MRPMVVNTKQRIAVLASGLAIATTGFVTDADASNAGVPSAAPAQTGIALTEEAAGDEIPPSAGQIQLDR